MTSQAKARSDELFQQYVRARAVGPLGELTRARLRHDAEALTAVDAIGSHVLLGLIASEAHDEKEVRRCFSVALRLAPAEGRVHYNYAIALAEMGYLSEARAESETAFELAPGMLIFADTLVHYATISGRFRRGAEILEQRRKLGSKEPHPDEGVLPTLVELAIEHGVSDTEIESLLSTASDILHDAGLFSPHLAYAVLEDEFQRFIGAEWTLNLTVEQVVHLNLALAKKLADSPAPKPAESLVTVVFVPNGTDGNTSN